MAKQKLSETAKQFLNFEDNTLNKPISFGETPVLTPKATSNEAKHYDKIPTVVCDAVRYLDLTDCLEFDEFLTSKSSNTTVQTDNDLFDEASFNADKKALERRYSEETAWLKMNPPKTLEAMTEWNKRLQARDNLRFLLPREEDPKYHSKEIAVLTKSGTECKSIISAFRDATKAITKKYDTQAQEENFNLHHITMSEDDFKVLKTLKRLGQLDIAKIPIDVIRSNRGLNTVRGDFESAIWHFETVADYNESLKTLHGTRRNDPNEDAEKLALMNTEIELAARALLSYCIEFKAQKEIEKL